MFKKYRINAWKIFKLVYAWFSSIDFICDVLIVLNIFSNSCSVFIDIQENHNTSIQENFKQYNKNNYYKRNNIGPEISEDVDGVPLWNKKRCEKEPMSEEDLELLNNWLKGFDGEGDDN